MGKRKSSKKNSNPDRNQRIQEMLAKEKDQRDSLDETNRQAKDLIHWAHYDKVQRERTATISALLPVVKDIFQNCMELRGKCIAAESNLETKLENLQSQLDNALGRQANRDSGSNLESVINTLPPERASALRFVMKLNKNRASSISIDDIKRMNETFNDLLANGEKRIAEYREAASDILLVFQEKMARGWVTEVNLEAYKATLEQGIQEIENMKIKHRQFLTNWVQRCEATWERIIDLESRVTIIGEKADANP